MCLYEENHKLMFTGDHVLGRISPNIAFWGYEYGDILGTFFESLLKVRTFNVELPLGAHREFSGPLNERIDELLLHHGNRLSEIKTLLSEEWQSVSDIASRMHWSIRVQNGWQDFPREQKIFASLEAMSHLIHLVQGKKAVMAEQDGITYFKLT